MQSEYGPVRHSMSTDIRASVRYLRTHHMHASYRRVAAENTNGITAIYSTVLQQSIAPEKVSKKVSMMVQHCHY